MSRVMLMEACPSISETTLGLTALESSKVAQVWRRSWKRIGLSPALFRSGLKERLRKFDGLMIVPVSVAMDLPGDADDPRGTDDGGVRFQALPRPDAR